MDADGEQKPIWWTRSHLEKFVIPEAEAWKIIAGPPWYCVVAWVTRDCQPVTCAMAYTLLDGQIALSSVRHRAKVKALERNPAISLCFRSDGFKQVVVRGRAEISDDRWMIHRWIAAHLDTWSLNPDEEERKLSFARYDSPDRVVILVKVERLLTFDGAMMLAAEQGDG